MIRGWLCESVRRKVAVLDTVSTKLLSVSSKKFLFCSFFQTHESEKMREHTFFVLVGMVFHSGWSTTSKKSILVMSHDIIGAI